MIGEFSMSSRYRWIVMAVGVGLLAMPAVIATQSTTDGMAAKEWPFYGGDLTNDRYSTLDQVNTQTIKNLGGAWTKKFDEGAASRQTPIVKDGRMFIGAGALV